MGLSKNYILKDSIPAKIMYFLADVGECSIESIYLAFSDISKGVIANSITTLKNKGYINVLNSGPSHVKTVRVKAKAGLPFLKDDELYYNRYMLMSANHKFTTTSTKSKNISSTLRRHRIASSLALMKSAGVVTGVECLPLSIVDRTNVLDIQADSFYTSIELKNLDVQQKHKLEFTRFVGCLFTEDTVFIVYNLDTGALKWSEQGEQKTRWFIQEIIAKNSNKKSWKLASIVLYSKDSALLSSLDVNNDKSEFLSFFNVFRNVYAIPVSSEGTDMVKSLSPINSQDILKAQVFGKKLLDASEEIKDCDCDVVDEDVRAFSFLSGNIARLRRLRSFIDLPSSSKLSFNFYCYDFQENFLYSFLIGRSNISVFSVN